jgi:hypothetical protein
LKSASADSGKRRIAGVWRGLLSGTGSTSSGAGRADGGSGSLAGLRLEGRKAYITMNATANIASAAVQAIKRRGLALSALAGGNAVAGNAVGSSARSSAMWLPFLFAESAGNLSKLRSRKPRCKPKLARRRQTFLNGRRVEQRNGPAPRASSTGTPAPACRPRWYQAERAGRSSACCASGTAGVSADENSHRLTQFVTACRRSSLMRSR